MVSTRQYAPNEVIIRENESGETAYIIEQGKVEVSKLSGGRKLRLAVLEKGAAFGEMSMVDDMPRSATVTAVEETRVREFHRDGLQAMMKENPDAMIKFLKSIFERLREANASLARHALTDMAPAPGAAPVPPRETGKPLAVILEGLTERAVDAIPDSPMVFMTFPFRIGRKCNDPLVGNDLEIADKSPMQISRHHVSILCEGGKLGVVDRGSQLGALVDGVRIGGGNGPGPVFFQGDEGVLVLGRDASPYRYKLKISA